MDLLFVYGTLITAFKHPVGEKLRSSAKYIGNGRVSGVLYDLGEYPGLVVSDALEGFVKGEIYTLDRCPDLWEELDAYEGINDSDTPEYSREKVFVEAESRRLTCWTYIYQGSVSNLTRIQDGDYTAYMQRKG